jgi:hypothetical protein
MNQLLDRGTERTKFGRRPLDRREAARKEQMTRRKLKRLALPALVVMIAAAVAVPAFAQTAPRATTLKAIGKASFKANRYVNRCVDRERRAALAGRRPQLLAAEPGVGR